jgi:hypothetical protein
MTVVTRATETEFLSQVIELARLFRWRVAHFRPAQTRHGWRTPVQADGKGFPDLVLVRDRVIFAELKSDSGRVNDDQAAWLGDLMLAGAETHTWRPRDLQTIAEVLR